MTKHLKLKQIVNAPAAEVYRAFTNALVLREWFCDAAQTDPRKGGRVYLWWNSGYYTSGEFVALTPGKKVAFTWHGRREPGATRVQIAMAEKDHRTTVTLTHAGIGAGKAWAKATKEFEREWQSALENLQSLLETGQDLRIVRRPMLGINLGVWNAEAAKKLGVPFTPGIRLDGIAAGMGAEKAGLQKEDVVVKMGSVKITGFASVSNVLQKHRAGDKLPIVFYRGGEKKTVTMELSRRPLPDVPPTAKGLADALRKLYDEYNNGLVDCFKGASEPEASFKPAPNEWSAKETLAHFIQGERFNYLRLSDLLNESERVYDNFDNFDNVQSPLDAIVHAFPTVSDLLTEYKRNLAETVSIIGALPDKFVAHKGTYWRVGSQLLQSSDHTRNHFEQIRKAIAAARK